VLSLTGPSYSQDVETTVRETSEGFKQGCNDYLAGQLNWQAMYCFGIVSTIADLNERNLIKDKLCKPNGISYKDMVRAVANNAYRYPSYLTAPSIGYFSLKSAFPCR
jgi:hypothetical protein